MTGRYCRYLVPCLAALAGWLLPTSCDKLSRNPEYGFQTPYLQVLIDPEQPLSPELGVVVRLVAAGDEDTFLHVAVEQGAIRFGGPGEGDASAAALERCLALDAGDSSVFMVMVTPDDIEALLFVELVQSPAGGVDAGECPAEGRVLLSNVQSVRMRNGNRGEPAGDQGEPGVDAGVAGGQ